MSDTTETRIETAVQIAGLVQQVSNLSSKVDQGFAMLREELEHAASTSSRLEERIRALELLNAIGGPARFQQFDEHIQRFEARFQKLEKVAVIGATILAVVQVTLGLAF